MFQSSKIGRYAWPAGIVLLGILCRIFYVFDFADSPLINTVIGPDTAEYVRRMREILGGDLIWPPDSIHAPLYPFFLAGLSTIFGQDLMILRVVQSILILLGGIPFYWILRDDFQQETTLRRHVPLTFLLIYAVYPPLLAYQFEFLSENLLLPLLGLCLYCAHRFLQSYYDHDTIDRHAMILAFLCGICGSLAAVTHPMTLIFLPLLLLFLAKETGILSRSIPMAVKKKSILAMGCMILGISLIVGGVSICNTVRLQRPVMVQTNSAFNFYLGNNPDATGSCYLYPGPAWQRFHADAEKKANEEGISVDSLFLRQAAQFILHHPVDYTVLLFRKAMLTLHWQELTSWSDASCLKLNFLHRHLFHLFWILAVPGLAVLILGVWKRRFREDYALFLLLFGASFASNILTLTCGRYRMVLVVMMMVFCADCLWSALLVIQRKRFRLLVSLGLAILISAAVVFGTPSPVSTVMERANALELLGFAYYESGENPVLAEQYLREAWAHQSDSERIPNVLGEVLCRQGRYDEAVTIFRDTIRKIPDSHFAYMNLATIYADSGEYEKAKALFHQAEERVIAGEPMGALSYNMGHLEHRSNHLEAAERYYREALKHDPINPMAMNNLGLLLLNTNRISEAEDLLRKACAQSPHVPTRHLNLALAMALNHKLQQALRLLERMKSRFPDHKSQIDAVEAQCLELSKR